MDANFVFDNQFISKVWDLIMCAKSTIDLSFYKAELPKKKQRGKINIIYQALFLKKKENVRIRVLLNKEQTLRGVSRYNVVVASFLKENNIPCRFLDNSRCCHAKLIIVDKSRLYIGSHNLSSNAVSRNFEAGLILGSYGLVPEINGRFDDLWGSAKNFT